MSQNTFLLLMYLPLVLLVVMLLLVAMNQHKELHKYHRREYRRIIQQAHEVDACQRCGKVDACQRCGKPGFAIYLCDDHYEDLIGH
jgi:hypothetical protein